MKKLIYILIMFLCPLILLSQQLPHYSLYTLNDVVINPALMSTKIDNQITLMVRDQWTGFQGAPKTQLLSYYNNNHDKYSRGISIVNDNTGPISMLSASLSGSYLIPIENRNKLSILVMGILYMSKVIRVSSLKILLGLKNLNHLQLKKKQK